MTKTLEMQASQIYQNIKIIHKRPAYQGNIFQVRLHMRVKFDNLELHCIDILRLI